MSTTPPPEMFARMTVPCHVVQKTYESVTATPPGEPVGSVQMGSTVPPVTGSTTTANLPESDYFSTRMVDRNP